MNEDFNQYVSLWLENKSLKLQLFYLRKKLKVKASIIEMLISLYWIVHFRKVKTGAVQCPSNMIT